jgi:large repetitive protein
VNVHLNAAWPLVGLAATLLLAGCAAGASPSPAPVTPTPIVTPSEAVATPASIPSPTATPAVGTSDCVVSTIAGKAGETVGAVDGTGAEAGFSGEPQYIVMDSAGAFFITDTADHVIRKMTPDGVVTTFAGKIGELGSVDGVGTAARFNRPSGLAIDRSDNLYVAGNEANDIRRITPDGAVTTLASKLGIEPSGIALDAAGNVYTGGWVGNVILKIAPDGTVTELAGKRGSPGWTDGKGEAARFQWLITVASDAHGVLWVADVATDLSDVAVRRVTPDGTVTTLKGDWKTYGLPSVIWFDSSGELYGTSYPGHTVMKIAQDGTVTLLAGKPGEGGSADGPGDVARFTGPIGVVQDASGLFYIVDSDNHTIRTMRCP